MKVDRQELETELLKVINKIKHDRNILHKIETNLIQYGVKPTLIDDIILGKSQLSEFDYSYLLLITNVLFEVTEDRNILPEHYFNESELKKGFIGEEKEINTITYPIIFESTIALSNEDFITTITTERIIELMNANLIHYNFETQRNAKLRRASGGTIIKVANVNKKSVKEIENELKNNTFYADTIRFNVLKDGNDDLVYDVKNFKLIINSGEIDIIDGFHRLQGAIRAYEKYGVNFTFELSIKNYTLKQAQKYVAQINTVNKMDKTHLQALKEDRLSDTIVKHLQLESELRGRIAGTSRISHSMGELTTFSILSDAINDVFQPNNKLEVREISEYLTEFFDYLLGYFEKEFISDVDEVRKTSLISNPNMFVGYIVLAKRFKDANKSVKEIKEVVSKIDFNKDSSELASIVNTNNKDNSFKVRKKIKEYFEQIKI